MVKKFHSKFSQIQRVREQHEQAARNDLALKTADLHELNRRQQIEQQQLQEVQQSLKSQVAFGAPGSFLQCLMQQVAMQESKLAKLTALQHNAALQVQLATHVLKAATLNRKTITELVAREHAEYRVSVIKDEDIQFQEQASQAWQRRRNATELQNQTLAAEGEHS